jgi:hypothetical protein
VKKEQLLAVERRQLALLDYDCDDCDCDDDLTLKKCGS